MKEENIWILRVQSMKKLSFLQNVFLQTTKSSLQKKIQKMGHKYHYVDFVYNLADVVYIM